MVHHRLPKQQPNTLFALTLSLCLILAGVTLFGSDLLSRAVQDNLLRLRLEWVLHETPPPADDGLLALLRAPGFTTQNPRVAWLAGYYVFSQTFSSAAAQSFWEMAPDYAAEKLLLQARTTPDRQEQLRAATAAATLAPATLPAQLALVDALIANDQWTDAAAAAERLLTAWPNDADVNALAGRATWRSSGSPERARALLERAMTLEPANTRAPGYMIEYVKSKGTPIELETFLIDRLKANTNTTLNAAFYTHLAELYLRQDNAVGAISAINAALDLQPKDPWVNKVAGDYWYAQQRFDQATEHYAVAAAVFSDKDTWLRLGGSYVQSSNLPMAVQTYCRLLVADATDPEVQTRLAELGETCR